MPRLASRTDPVTVAAVQMAPVPFDTEATVARVVDRLGAAAEEGADLVVFPEAMVGGYPWGLAFGTAVGGRSPEGRRTWERYRRGAVEIPGPEIRALGQAARSHGVHVAVGVVERDTASSGGTLYCTLVYLGPGGDVLGVHRKLKPTAAERFIWGEGDGSTLPVLDTALGRVGGLICWENYMPLARMAMYAQGVEIYLAPTADARERWQATLRHIAVEGRCAVVGCNQFVTRSMYPADLEISHELEGWPETLCPGGSAVYGPAGELLAGPLENEEGILVARLEPEAVGRAKFDFDVAGHYARPDVFRLHVDTSARGSVVFGEDAPEPDRG
jgi:nitrilase